MALNIDERFFAPHNSTPFQIERATTNTIIALRHAANSWWARPRPCENCIQVLHAPIQHEVSSCNVSCEFNESPFLGGHSECNSSNLSASRSFEKTFSNLILLLWAHRQSDGAYFVDRIDTYKRTAVYLRIPIRFIWFSDVCISKGFMHGIPCK